LTKLLENNECPECKKKTSLRRTEPELMNKMDTSFEGEHPTGLVKKVDTNEKIPNVKSTTDYKKNALEKTY